MSIPPANRSGPQQRLSDTSMLTASMLTGCSRARLEAMLSAANEIQLCQTVLAKSGDSVLSELLRPDTQPHAWRHYPQGDVFDGETHGQYYFHAHAPEERVASEIGHIHCFLRAPGMPQEARPWPGQNLPDNRSDNICHLFGISLDSQGQPFRLFTTNRWVTGETWYAADDVIRMLDRFVIRHARPSWPANRWVSALVALFYPQIESLLHARDERICSYSAALGLAPEPSQCAFEDRTLELTSEVRINLDAQCNTVRAVMAER